MRKLTAVLIVVVALTWTATAQAALVLFDMPGFNSVAQFATALPAPFPDTNGHFWNAATDDGSVGLAVTDAVDSANNPTTIDLNVTDDFSTSFGGFLASGLAASVITDWDANVTQDFWFLDLSRSAQIRIEGLTANGSYDLTFYGSRSAGTDNFMDVTIGATTQSYNGRGAAGEGMTTFAGVVANGSGEILVDFGIQSGSSQSFLGAITIEDTPAIPEPSSLSLLISIVGAVLLQGRRRKR